MRRGKKYFQRKARLQKLHHKKYSTRRRKYLRIKRLYGWCRPMNPTGQRNRYIQNNKGRINECPVPTDFRLLNNTLDCSLFFRRLLNMEGAEPGANGASSIYLGIRQIKHIDFASTLMLNAIEEELVLKKCNVRSKLPKQLDCRRYLIDSGYLNKKFGPDGKMINNPGNSLVMDIQRGEDKIKANNLRAFVSLLNKVYQHLGSEKSPNHDSYMSMIKEICGNSAEWGDIINKNWTIGAKFEDDKVIFVALDLGQGILNSLRRNFWDKVKDLKQSDHEILEGAFKEHYGSKSEEDNRNQGLPFIRECQERNIIENLYIVTNNAIISIADSSHNKTLSSSTNIFPGTLYCWELTKNCITNN